jgi:hypothetical protein
MTHKTISPILSVRSLLLLMAILVAGSSGTLGLAPFGQPASAAEAGDADVRGTWSGNLVSKHTEVTSFTMRVVITQDADGNLLGQSTISSNCLQRAKLQVRVQGSKIVLAGSDEQGDSITLRGRVDDSGAVVKFTYILDGSATGRCETDDGIGSLTRQ